MKIKTVIMVPNLKLTGGVSNYYRVAYKYLSDFNKYVHINSPLKKGFFKPILNGIFLLTGLLRILFLWPKNVVVNPSLSVNALLRDGLIVCWSLLFRRKVFIFWRGWNPQKEYLFQQKCIVFLFKISFIKAHCHLTLNSHVKGFLSQNGVPPEKIKSTSTIVDDSFFDSFGDTHGQKFIILFLARVEKYKGIYESIEILKILDQYSDVELQIAGNGTELKNVKKLISDEGMENIRFLDFLSGNDKLRAYQRSHCYLFPSYSEGMPNSVLEAMACGLPIICTRVGALEDFFIDKKMGFSFKLPIDIKAFTSAIKEIMSDSGLRKKIGEFNKKYAKENFMASLVISHLDRLFNKE